MFAHEALSGKTPILASLRCDYDSGCTYGIADCTSIEWDDFYLVSHFRAFKTREDHFSVREED